MTDLQVARMLLAFVSLIAAYLAYKKEPHGCWGWFLFFAFIAVF